MGALLWVFQLSLVICIIYFPSPCLSPRTKIGYKANRGQIKRTVFLKTPTSIVFTSATTTIGNMNLFIVLVVVSMFLNFIQAAPSVDISNDELMDGKYLCEDISALKQFGNSESLRTTGFVDNDDFSTTSPLFNEFYKLFLRNMNQFLSKNKHFGRQVSKRGLDSIGGGHLIKRTENRQLLTD